MKVWGYLVALAGGAFIGWVAQQFWSASTPLMSVDSGSNAQLARNELRIESLKRVPQVQTSLLKEAISPDTKEVEPLLALIETGQLDSAIEVYLAHLEYYMAKPDLGELLVDELLQQQRYRQVLDFLYERRLYIAQEHEAKFLQSVYAVVERIDQSLAEQLQLNDLVSIYRQLVSLHPDYAPYTLRLAHWLMELQEFDLAQESLLGLANAADYQEAFVVLSREIETRKSIKNSPAQTIPLKRSGSHFVAAMNIADDGIVELLLDTGATLSVLKTSVLDALNTESYDSRDISMKTANGVVLGQRVTLPKVMLNGLALEGVSVGVMPLPDFQHDGLLGMDILGKFKFYIDQEQAVLYLR